MSHAVSPHELAKAAESYDATPFLLYPSADGSVRAVHVRASVKPGEPLATISGFGRGIPAAIERDAPFTLLWPSQAGGFSLIADGSGTLVDDETVTITITSAVLHRPAPDDGARSC